jgi:hypothetical protein
LENAQDYLRALEAVYNDYKSEVITDQEAKCSAYVLQVGAGILRTNTLERRVDEMEVELAALREKYNK